MALSDPLLRRAALAGGALLGAHLLYRFVFRSNRIHAPNFFDNKSEKWRVLRRRAFPPGCPRGWYQVVSVAELQQCRIKNISLLGTEFVAFMDDNGKIAVLDAHCPHMGAHLGCGGKIVEGNLQCPYHSWRFNAEGQCVNIPYTTAPIPAAVRARTHHIRIYADLVFLWYDSEGSEPAWELDLIPDLHGTPDAPAKMVYHRMAATTYNMHIAEMAENSPDYYHFTNMHGPLPLPLLHRFFTARYDTKMYFDEKRDHVELFDNWATVYFLNKYKLSFTTTLTRVLFEGPAIVHFEVFTDLGRIRLLKTLVPPREFEVYSEDRWYAEPSVPRWLVWIVARIAAGALEQDRPIWENKIFLDKPTLVAGDGPFREHRRWWSQFYNQSQLYESEKTMTW